MINGSLEQSSWCRKMLDVSIKWHGDTDVWCCYTDSSLSWRKYFSSWREGAASFLLPNKWSSFSQPFILLTVCYGTLCLCSDAFVALARNHMLFSPERMSFVWVLSTVALKNVLLYTYKGKKAQFKHWNSINAASPLICCSYKCYIGHICIICRSVCAYQKNPAGGSWGGSALSQPAYSDQAMPHKALLYVAAG